MPLGHRRTVPAVIAAMLALPLQPASAQDLFGWFGSDDPAPRRPAAGYAISRPGPGSFGSTFFSPFGGSFFSPFQPELDPLPKDDGPYRTLCVRMCDGYYFPISHSTGSANLSRDAERCAASCGGDARLFYHANPGGDVETMLDLTGRTYASYPTAFKYRRTLVAGCQCRPQPWAESELARHRTYALAEKAAADKSEPVATGGPAPEKDAEVIPRPADVRRPWAEAAGAAPVARSRHKTHPTKQVQSESDLSWLFGDGGVAVAPKIPRSSYASPGGR